MKIKPGFHLVAECRRVMQPVAEFDFATRCYTLRQDFSISCRVLQCVIDLKS